MLLPQPVIRRHAALLASLALLAILSAPQVGRFVARRSSLGVPPPCLPTDHACDRAVAAGLATEPEYGRGAAFVDIDGDGWEDIWDSNAFENKMAPSRLWRNRGDGTYEPLELGIDFGRYRCSSWAGSWADYDNDGDPDLLLVNASFACAGMLVLFRNDFSTGGRMTDVSAAAGIPDAHREWWNASWADFNRDGFSDFAVVDRLGGTRIYENRNGTSFHEVAADVGVTTSPSAFGRNPVWFDFNRDGWPDLYVAGETHHSLFQNDGGMRFIDASELLDTRAYTEDCFGRHETPGPCVFTAAAEDFDQDGWIDLYLGRWWLQDIVLMNRGGKTFDSHGRDVGLDMATAPDMSENTMGLGVGDITEDGYPDVIIGTGHPAGTSKPLIYCSGNEGGVLRFRRCNQDMSALLGASHTHGIAIGDPDHDGDADIFFNRGGSNRWDKQHGANHRAANAYIVRSPRGKQKTAAVRLVGTVSNRDAIGAMLSTETAPKHYYPVHSGQGFQSHNSPWLLITLGDADTVPIRIIWPSGTVSTANIQNGERVTITEPAGRP